LPFTQSEAAGKRSNWTSC